MIESMRDHGLCNAPQEKVKHCGSYLRTNYSTVITINLCVDEHGYY